MAEENENLQAGPEAGQAEKQADEIKEQVKTVQEPDKAVEVREASKDARNLAMLLHLLGIVGFFAPLVIWVTQKDKYKFVDEHGKAAMNYHISLIIYYAAAWLSCVVLIGVLLVPALMILHIVLVIMATIKASNGQLYQYPIAIKFLK